jgi:hypothetical protein
MGWTAARAIGLASLHGFAVTAAGQADAGRADSPDSANHDTPRLAAGMGNAAFRGVRLS